MERHARLHQPDPLSADYVSEDLRRRHGDLVWKVRFRDRWLSLMLLLEFQTTVERTMAVRMLAYTALLYRRLIAEGELPEDGALPPVLPIVICNGRRSWTAAADVSKLVKSSDPVLKEHQPSQRYSLPDEDQEREARDGFRESTGAAGASSGRAGRRRHLSASQALRVARRHGPVMRACGCDPREAEC